MGKVKNTLVLLLTAGLVCLLALLPKFTGWAQDAAALGEVDYRDSVQVQLEIREDMPLMGKLSLLCRMDSVIEVPEALAQSTAEEAEQAALEALRPYIEAGLIPEQEMACYECRSILFQTERDELTGIMWSVVFTGVEDTSFCVQLDLDDATGKLLRLHFSWGGVTYTDREACLEIFAETYFTGLGIADWEDFVTDDLQGQYIGDDVAGVRYRFGDVIYGEINVALFVYRSGFYVELG